MIIAVSHEGDEHAGPVLEALRRLGAEAVLLDTSAFPSHAAITLEYGRRRAERVLETHAGSICARQVTAVWWRRPLPLTAEPSLTAEHRAFAVRQSYAALAGLGASLDARWINQPRSHDAARKPRQLASAERVGIPVPRTLVTSDPKRAREFLGAARRGVIHKAVDATLEDWRTTRLVGAADVARLDSLRLAPAILQEFVPGIDVRVTVVGDRMFAASIDAKGTCSPQDFRPVFDDAKVEACKLPSDVARRLRALVKDLGLAYAAIDLRRRKNGDYVFLEVNPSGQWLFIERRTGLAITEALAKLLAGSIER